MASYASYQKPTISKRQVGGSIASDAEKLAKPFAL